MIYKILSVLLSYPSQDLKEALPDITSYINNETVYRESLEGLIDHLKHGDLIDLQEEYVATFDRNPKHSLHLFEHLHGEDRARGQALLDLLHEFQKHGVVPVENEMPDYLPLILEFLSVVDEAEQQSILGDMIHILAYIGQNLHSDQSVYGAVFAVLESLSPVRPEPLKSVAIKDMDEALEVFGPEVDGTEPLLTAGRPASSDQEIKFYKNTQKNYS